MGEAGFPGARLSLVVWTNVMRFVANGAIPVRHLAAQGLASDKQVKFELGCLERWGFVALVPDPADGRSVPTVTHRRSGHELREGGAADAAFAPTGGFTSLPRGLQRAKFCRRYSARLSNAGRSGSARPRSAACSRPCRTSRTNLRSNCLMAYRAVTGTPRSIRAGSRVAKAIFLCPRC